MPFFFFMDITSNARGRNNYKDNTGMVYYTLACEGEMCHVKLSFKLGLNQNIVAKGI